VKHNGKEKSSKEKESCEEKEKSSKEKEEIV
jgi:hypothetical protein